MEIFYVCPRCGMQFNGRGGMRTHLYRVKVCANINGIELTEEIRQHVLANKVLNSKNINIVKDLDIQVIEQIKVIEEKEQSSGKSNNIFIKKKEYEILIEDNKKMKEDNKIMKAEISKLKNAVSNIYNFFDLDEEMKCQQKESYYQKILENHLSGQHLTVGTGITDVSTDGIHAEIKIWRDYRQGIAQLLLYNAASKRDRLQLYLFGNCTKTKHKQIVIDYVPTLNIEVYEFVHDGKDVQIVDLRTGKCIAVCDGSVHV